MQIGQNVWLSVWSNATVAAEAAGTHAPSGMYLAVYFLLGVALLVASFSSGVFVTIGTVNAARTVYENFAAEVLTLEMGLGPRHRPMTFSMSALLWLEQTLSLRLT